MLTSSTSPTNRSSSIIRTSSRRAHYGSRVERSGCRTRVTERHRTVPQTRRSMDSKTRRERPLATRLGRAMSSFSRWTPIFVSVTRCPQRIARRSPDSRRYQQDGPISGPDPSRDLPQCERGLNEDDEFRSGSIPNTPRAAPHEAEFSEDRDRLAKAVAAIRLAIDGDGPREGRSTGTGTADAPHLG
jgi:hypothetical protein